MFKNAFTLVSAASLFLTSYSFAATPAEIAKANNCLACHSVDQKIVGPSYKEVAAKYKGNKKAEALLIAKVKNGGSGSFGPMPMPPNPQVSDADLKTLVKWILAQK
ncbi:c-type cytochrome [Amantichitinum ursilacus]|uniref:Cytochrome c-552 n=1 Tax=Amantichitinum ursilacus TaxID=857265 RepID=A0A0N0XKW5_9NEIS|nr:c-type cytochrome [Amantichitinum ursilacus]KPC54585.1 Cytochrome c-552 precursor [Amantichitinum ursilacus]